MFLTEKQVLQPSSSVISLGCCNMVPVWQLVRERRWYCVAGGLSRSAGVSSLEALLEQEFARPRFARPTGHRTCSTGLLSYSEPGPGRPLFRGGFSPPFQTGSHWAGGIPPVFGNVKDRISYSYPQTILTKVGVLLHHEKDAGLQKYYCHFTPMHWIICLRWIKKNSILLSLRVVYQLVLIE